MTKADAREVARTTALLTRKADNTDAANGARRLDPVEDALTLHRIAGSLHRYDERGCSEDLGCRKCDGNGTLMRAVAGKIDGSAPCPACAATGSTIGKRVASLEAKAAGIASAYGFRAYFQGDCRGCPLYLIPGTYPATEDACNYNSRGVAVVWLG
jgi:hypothetical protein